MKVDPFSIEALEPYAVQEGQNARDRLATESPMSRAHSGSGSGMLIYMQLLRRCPLDGGQACLLLVFRRLTHWTWAARICPQGNVEIQRQLLTCLNAGSDIYGTCISTAVMTTCLR